MEQSQNLLIFGDQTVEKLPLIRALVQNSKTSPAAKRFLQEATDVLQLEFSKVSQVEHGWTRSFDTLLGLAEENADQDGNANIMVATMLMCIGRLGDLVLHAEKDPAILGTARNPVQVLGFCTGLLPASAIIAAKDMSDLFTLSREIISITFRMALQGRSRMQLVEAGPLNGMWARTYVGLTEEKAQRILKEFHDSQSIPTPRRIAIGVISNTWVTLFGAPSSLARLQAWSTELETVPSIDTDSGGPVHNPYLPPIDVNQILGGSGIHDLRLDWSKARLFSPVHCEEYKHATYGELLDDILTGIMHKVLRVSDVIDASIGSLDVKLPVQLIAVGPTGHKPAVEQLLKQRHIEYQEANDNPTKRFEVTVQARGGSDQIAVVGMSGRFPGSDTVEGFWKDLLAGKNHIKKIPESRFDLEHFYDPTGKKKNSTTAQHGAFLDEPGLFDHRLFNVSPRESSQMDPMVRLSLATSYEALESAGYFPGGTPSTQTNRIATYLGQTGEDWHEMLNNEGVDIYYVPSTCRAFGPGRINYQYKFGGGSFALDSACASSTTAISLACSALIARECDTALAGGGSVLVSPNSFSGLSKANMLSTTGGCRTYHDDADGYCRGEAVAMVVLKRLEDAEADNDNILGVIRGSTRTYSHTASSITHPCHIAQERVYNEVLRQSSLDPAEISYVEMHGTGTQAGDLEEMESVINVMGQKRSRDNSLVVGAVKASIGHGEAAAGVTSLIKVLMMMRDRVIPPQPGWPFTLNRNFPSLDKLNIKIATKQALDLRASPRGDGKIKVLVNSLDASGGNTSLAVEEPPAPRTKTVDPRGGHVVTLSARTLPALQKNRERLFGYLERNPHTKLADLAYTTTARRMHESLRLAYVGKTTSDIERQLRDDIVKSRSSGGGNDPKAKVKQSRCVFIFTGQGSHYAGMGRDLFQTNPLFANTLVGYQVAAEAMALPTFLDIIADEEPISVEDMTTRFSATQVQLAIVALEMALVHLLRTWGVVPDIVIGHSLGEYAALYAASVLSASDVLYLVGHRAILMEKHLTPNTYAMLATSIDVESLQQSIGTLSLSTCNVACINAPSVSVASGTIQDLGVLQNQMQRQVTKEGTATRTTLLKVPYGFHSSQIDPILGEFQDLARGVVFAKSQIPIVSTLTGKLESIFSPEYLARQAREPVNFVRALQTLKKSLTDNTTFIEIGPGPVGLGLVRQTLDLPPSARLVPTLKSSEDNWTTISNCLKAVYEGGSSVNWPEVHRGFKDSVTLLDLPKYAFDNRNFWTSYTNPVPVPLPVGDTKTVEWPKLSGFPTSSVQRVESENVDESGDKITMVFSSNLDEPHLLEAIEGHVVNKHKICPMGIFTDVAMTTATYAYFRLHGHNSHSHSQNDATPEMSLHDFLMSHALAIVPGPKPTLYTTITYTASTKAVNVVFHSYNGKKETTHGTCRVQFGKSSEAWRASSRQTLFLLQTRVEALNEQAAIGKAHRILKPVVYKLFSDVVDYSERYKAIEEVVLDAGFRDALGTVKLSSTNGDHFMFDPYGIDAVTHLAGFVLNSGLRYGEEVACISVGFDSWRELEKLNHDKTYRSYVCMQEVPNGPFITGDCYVFEAESGRLVQATIGLKFQKLKKIVLDTVLGVVAPATRGGEVINRPTKIEKASVVVSQSHFIESPPPSLLNSKLSTLPSTSTSTPLSTFAQPANPEILDQVLSIVAAESGCGMEELMEDSTTFADLGVDSLMAITVLAVVKRETGLDLDAGFFLEHETIGTAKRALLERYGPNENTFPPTPPLDHSEQENIISHEPSVFVSEPVPEQLTTKFDLGKPAANVPISPATPPVSYQPTRKLVHLQGPRRPDVAKLFLIADETGSALGYIPLPSLGPNLCVYGVESPFARELTALDDDITLTQLVGAYVTAIRNEQAHGPYLVGGISVGATVALEVVRTLLQSGENVNGLLLLDPLNGELMEMRLAAKLAGSMKPVQKGHVRRMLQILREYEPEPLAIQPRTAVAVMRDQAVETLKKEWKPLVPGLMVQQLDDAGSGSLLKFPALSVFGQSCKVAVAILRE